jgi:hypothetical protein
MKRKLINYARYLLLLSVIITIQTSAQVPTSYLVSLRNDVQPSPMTFQFDIYLQNTDLVNIFELDIYQLGILVNPAIVNGGTITPSIVAGSSQLNLIQQPTTGITFASNCIKLANPGIPTHGSGTIIPTTSPGLRIATIQLNNSVPFAQASPNLTFCFTTVPFKTAFFAFNQTSPYTAVNLTNASFFKTSDLTNRVLNGPPVTISISGVTANDKIYDGTTTAFINTTGAILVGVIGADIVALSIAGVTGYFADPTIGNNKPVTISGFTISGPEAWNYILVQPTTTASILNVILPIELLSFAFTCAENGVALAWETATETNNDYFTIQKSLDDINYTNVANINGAGNSNSVLQYSFLDESENSGTRYYRLKQNDFDGNYSYSNTIATSCIYKLQDSDYYNLFATIDKEIKIQLLSTVVAKVYVKVYDLNGREVATLLDDADVDTGFHSFTFNLNKSGVFIVKTLVNNKYYSNKIILF